MSNRKGTFHAYRLHKMRFRHRKVMQQLTLEDPVGLLMQPTDTIAAEDSLLSAAEKLHHNRCGILPVTDNGEFIGVVTEASFAKLMANSNRLSSPCKDATIACNSIEPYATGAEALRVLATTNTSALIVLDDRSHVAGIVCGSDLVPRDREFQTPPMVGGMATPFGVYLTSGSTGAGARGVALVTTGMLMFGMFLLGGVITNKLESMYAEQVPEWIRPAVFALGPLVIFLALMRILPISGTHGAEHQVVHALERGEPLIPEVVRRMPRVHPRCGTNLAVAAMLFLSLFQWKFTSNDEIRFIVAIVVTLFIWQPVGNFFQQYLTTRKPTKKQLDDGIEAAQELIEVHAEHGVNEPTIAMRIINSGALHVILGSALMYAAALVAQSAFGWNLGVDLLR